jgi:hypothetical protein
MLKLFSGLDGRTRYFKIYQNNIIDLFIVFLAYTNLQNNYKHIGFKKTPASGAPILFAK